MGRAVSREVEECKDQEERDESNGREKKKKKSTRVPSSLLIEEIQKNCVSRN